MVNVKTRTCFVVGPIGEPDSDARIHADWVLEEIIQPVISQLPDFALVRADQIGPPGMIDAQVIQYLLESELVIADLSRANPNAFYEIGIRHMAQKPIIHMQLASESIPFDLSLYRTIKFARARPADLRKAREELKRTVDAVIADGYKADNPVTRARGQIRLEESATPEQRVMMEAIRGLQQRVDGFETLVNRNKLAPLYSEQRSSGGGRQAYKVEIDDSDPGQARKAREAAMDILVTASAGSIELSGDGVVFRFDTFDDVEKSKKLGNDLRAIPGVKNISNL